jgi:hypothetical protein
MTTWVAGNGKTVSTFLATRTSRNISIIGTFQKRPAEVATGDEEAATAGGGYDGGYSTVSPVHPVQYRVVQFKQCIQSGRNSSVQSSRAVEQVKLRVPPLATTLPRPAGDRARLPITALSIT